MSDSTKETQAHIDRVKELLDEAIENIQSRRERHDKSKLEEPEKSGFDEVTNVLHGITYGSPEYKAQLEKLKPFLRHHYEHNTHHPEHYPNGVEGMSLFDLLEMFFDWKAATERHADGSIERSIEQNTDRFNLSPQLASILENTRIEMGW